MNYKVNILTKCENDQEISAVIAAALSMVLEEKGQKGARSGLVVKNIRRGNLRVPEWNIVGRHERFERKLNT